MSGTDESGEEPYDGPEAPAWVAELLAGLPADDPQIPDDVASRLDAVLATLAASPGPAPAAGGDAAGAAPGAGDDADPATGPATVVPIGASGGSRHRGGRPNPWAHRLLLGGVAAAAVVVLGGLGFVAVQRGSTTHPSDGIVVADSAGSPAQPPAAYVSSGLAYTSANLVPTARELLVATGLAAPTVAAPTVTPPTTSTATPAPSPGRVENLTGAADRPSATCVTALTGSTSAAPLVVDEATYNGKPAFVVVLPTDDDPSTVDVWVVERTCSAGADGTLMFAHVAR